MALKSAVHGFAVYINEIHNLVHPFFADRFLSSFDTLPKTSPINAGDAKAVVEFVVEGTSGHLIRAAIAKSSEIGEFDDAVLQSIVHAAPFSPPPMEIRSPDGNVYLQWEFYRDPCRACSSYFAHPFLLKGPPSCSMQLPLRREQELLPPVNRKPPMGCNGDPN